MTSSDDLSDPSVLARRKPVWSALSDLCLDTEITDTTIAHIARTIREQGFSESEAQAIAFEEVFPVVYTNLKSVAGEWAGFSEDWLVTEILKRKPKAGASLSDYPILSNDWDRLLSTLRQK